MSAPRREAGCGAEHVAPFAAWFVALLLVLAVPASALAQSVRPAVALGRAHALALGANGDVLTWGDNVMCQLGRRGPAGTPGLVLRNAIAIAAASDHNLVLTADGRVYGWGMNPEGALGTGATDDVCEGPVLVASLADNKVTHIATGNGFSVAVTETGDLYCAGDNSAGQCPARRTDATVFALLSMPELAGNVASIAAGAFHTLVLTRDGRVHAFGRGREGQLGNGRTVNGSSRVSGLTDVVAIAAGTWHSAAVRADGSAWLWGDNHTSQLCDGTTAARPAPTQVALDTGGVRVTEVTAGGHATLLRASGGDLYACGDNEFGALGGDRPPVVPRPARIATATHAWPLAVSGASGVFSTDGCRVRLAGDLSLCGSRPASALPTVVNEAPDGGRSGCWAPRLLEDEAASPRFAALTRAMFTAEASLATNAAFLAPPVPARMRAHLAAGPEVGTGASLHVKVVPERKPDGTRLWTAGCGVIPQLDRIGGAIMQVSVFFNRDVRSIIGPSGRPPERTGQLGPYPEYEGWVVITRDDRLPWVPETLADALDREAANRRHALEDGRRVLASMPRVDSTPEFERIRHAHTARVAMLEAQVREAEQHRASFSADELRAPGVRGDATGDGKRQRDAEVAALRRLPAGEQQQVEAWARERRTLEAQARSEAKGNPQEAARLRAAAADLARRARAVEQAHMEQASIAIAAAMGRYDLRTLQPGPADRALRVKPNPALPDAGMPDRIQVVLLRVSQDPDARQTARRAWQRQVRATIDLAALAALLD